MNRGIKKNQKRKVVRNIDSDNQKKKRKYIKRVSNNKCSFVDSNEKLYIPIFIISELKN